MATFEEWTLFLASPGDVNGERDVVRKVVDEFNDSLGKLGEVRVRVVGWDTDGSPSWGADAQKILNRQIGDMKQHALFVGLFWNRIGTKTPRARSGTIEEFKNAAKLPVSQRPEIKLYFSQKAATLGAAQARQRAELLDWKESLQPGGLYWEFKSTRNFETIFRKQYGDWLREKIQKRVVRGVSLPVFESINDGLEYTKARQAAKTPVAKTATRKPPVAKPKAPAEKRILLGGDVFVVEDVREIGANWTMTLRPKTPAEDKKIRDLLNKFPHSFGSFSLAYQLQAGKANVVKPGERSSDSKGDYWKLELRFVPARGATQLVNYQGMNADEIAKQKAKWLLLGQEPVLPTPRNSWDRSDQFLLQVIKDHGAGATPILAELWRRVGQSNVLFAPMASLVVVEQLLNGEVCEHIEELKIGAVSRGQVKVKFRGTRISVTSREGQVIEFEGSCPLPFKSDPVVFG